VKRLHRLIALTTYHNVSVAVICPKCTHAIAYYCAVKTHKLGNVSSMSETV